MDATEESEKIGWWKSHFYIAWDDRSKPAQPHIDLAIAHGVLKSIIDEFNTDFRAWRFHRRFKNDKSGHIFSFYFYTNEEVAKKVFYAINKSSFFNELKTSGVIRDYQTTAFSAGPSEEFGAETCADWPPQIKNTWAYYINGAYRMWLSLIDEVIGQIAPPGEEITLDVYQQADEFISGLWRDFGGHAFIHHLSEVFGYRPVLVRGREERF